MASACARFDRSRLRHSWKASVCWAPGSTLIMPRQTACERSARMPRKARSEVVFGALRAEDPRLLVEVLPADVAQLRVLAHHKLDDGVEQRLGLGVAGQVLLPHLGLG